MGKGTKSRGGLSKKEWEKANGKKWDGGGDSKSSSSGSYEDIVNEILGAYDGKQGAMQSFEDFYDEHPELQKEDRAQSEAMFKPFYEQQIGDTMEDLRVWDNVNTVNYKRVLRQGRAKMARGGGAIGTERTGWEGEVKQDNDFNRNSKLRNTEREVGSNRMKDAGYSPLLDNRKGNIIDEMDAAIREQEIFYRDQRSERFNYDSEQSYKG